MSREGVEIGSVVGGRFVVRRLLGKGGMGSVSLAEDGETGAWVALKVLHKLLANERRHLARFQREAEVMGILDHPHVVRAIASGLDPDGTAWLAMEYIDGETLSARARRDAPMGVPAVVSIARQIVAALGAAHAVGVVHRDLKPANVLIGATGSRGERVKVVDFGIARFVDSAGYQKLTSTGQVVGTPSYMAPEQVYGDSIDHRADLYCVGAVMHTLLTGAPPFGRGRFEEIVPRLMQNERQPLTITHRELGPIAEVVERCLQWEPEHRPATAETLEVSLRAVHDEAETVEHWRLPPTMAGAQVASDPPTDTGPRRRPTMAAIRARTTVIATSPGTRARPAAEVPAPAPTAAPAPGAVHPPAQKVTPRSPLRLVAPLAAVALLLGGAVIVIVVTIVLARSDDAPAPLAAGSAAPALVAPVSAPIAPVAASVTRPGEQPRALPAAAPDARAPGQNEPADEPLAEAEARRPAGTQASMRRSMQRSPEPSPDDGSGDELGQPDREGADQARPQGTPGSEPEGAPGGSAMRISFVFDEGSGVGARRYPTPQEIALLRSGIAAILPDLHQCLERGGINLDERREFWWVRRPDGSISANTVRPGNRGDAGPCMDRYLTNLGVPRADGVLTTITADVFLAPSPRYVVRIR